MLYGITGCGMRRLSLLKTGKPDPEAGSNMITIGLTGGYATGKSTVAGMLAEAGAAVIDADELAHAAIRRGQPGYDEALAVFGAGILGPDGEIDRSALGRIVFAQPERRKELERIVHPRVIATMRALRAREEAAGTAVLVFEVPLLFEAGLEKEFDHVWVVAAPPSRQIAMAASRGRRTGPEIEARIAAQMPMAEKERRADLVIMNDGDRERLRRRVAEAWSSLGVR